MAAAASLLPTCAAAPCLPGRASRPTSIVAARRVSVPAASFSLKTKSGSCGHALGVRRNAAAETYVTVSGKYITLDYLVKKVTAKELEELVRGRGRCP